jgi:DNA-binding NtrC family response regulator
MACEFTACGACTRSVSCASRGEPQTGRRFLGEEPPMDVMIVEGDVRTVKDIKTALKGFACRITSAATPEACLALADRQSFDLVLFDLSLTRPRGCEEIIQRLKDLRPEMKIITMAAQCNLDLERAIRRHGILFYMTKPIAPVLVRELVTHLMRSKSATEHGLNTFPGKGGGERRSAFGGRSPSIKR